MRFVDGNARPSHVGFAEPDGTRLIAALLREQGELTAVERFSRDLSEAGGPHQARGYSALLPARPPGPGRQLAFEVDLDRCSGCKACVTACHALNGLADGETWRDVGLLVGGSPRLPVIQHVTSACHHCVDPGCLAACPVEAYEKDPVLGIVRHLDDQCIGCKYCTMACPYDVPKYNSDKGIVRKCDMCADRLAVGEAPACVQACPHEAIRIRVVDVAETEERAAAGEFLPGAFDPSYTKPSTRFLSRRSIPLQPADGERPRPERGHTPLAAMLVLTQLAAGGFVLELAARLAGASTGIAGRGFLPLCLGLGWLGLFASLRHLGRPRYAYRAVLGFGHSWLSREIVALGLFAKLGLILVGTDLIRPGLLDSVAGLRIGLLAATALAGAAGVACSVMVYHVVRRPFWRARISGWKFAGTSLALGLSAALACAAVGRPGAFPSRLALLLALTTAAKLRLEAADRRGADWSTALGRTAWLLNGPLRMLEGRRRFLGVAGGIVLPGLAGITAAGRDPGATVAAAVLAFAACLAGEWIERRLFFEAVSSPRMPGGLPS